MSNSPGLKWRVTAKGRQPYWVASQVVRDPKGYPDKTIRLPADADAETLRKLCRDYTALLHEWLAHGHKEPSARYDGTVGALCRVFQEHPESRFHEVKRNTRESYVDSLKVIENTVGARRIRFLTVIDVKRWHRNWRAPKQPARKSRDKRAHDAVNTLRMILRFGMALGFTDCKDLLERLTMLRFEKPGAREQEMTFAQATAFIRKALELCERDMAIGVAAQFDLLLRQKDIIGEWSPATPGIKGAVYAGNEMWTGRFCWENVPGWMFRIKTSKTRSAIEFDLTKYTLLFPLLGSVPHVERVGAIVKGVHGLPIRERTYRKRFRRIARVAGIPDEVWSMDSRAGGATEADEAGADFKAISDHLTHADARTTVRYIRRVVKRTAEVADARAQRRKSSENDA